MTSLFDKAHYQALLKRLEISEVDLALLDGDMRVDAEFFRQRFLRDDFCLDRFSRHLIGEIAFVTDGQHGYFETDQNSPIHMVVARNVKNWFVDIKNAEPLAKWVDDNNQRSSLQENDVIVATRGTVGCCAIVGADVLPANINQDVARVKIQDNRFLPEYLIAYLNSSFGQDWLLRNQTGMVQQGVPLQKLRSMPIPLLAEKFQTNVKAVLKNARNKLAESASAMKLAESILLAELGLLNWKPPTRTVTQKNLCEFYTSGRLDAEYYQPKYDELQAIIEKNAKTICLISEIQEFNARGLQPIYDQDGPLDVINSKHILDDGLDYDNFEKTSINNWEEQQKAQVFRNDILIYTTGANIGRTAIYLSDKQALASNHVNILRVKAKDKIYVAFVLNSLIGRLQTEKLSAGSAQQELYPKDVAQFYVPFISEEKQAEISKKILESFALRAQSQELLELAKRAVEVAIESGEDSALAMLKSF